LKTLGIKYNWKSKEREFFLAECQKNIYFPELGGAQFGQIVSGVDELYKDYANKHIPIFAIATLVQKRITGEIKINEVEPVLQKLRKTDWGK